MVLRNLWRRKMQTLLALAEIAVGIAVVVALVLLPKQQAVLAGARGLERCKRSMCSTV